MKEEKAKVFIDKELISILMDRNISKDCIIGVMLSIKTKEKQRMLKKYAAFKGKYLTESDLLSYTMRLELKRAQYYPWNMYVKYIGNTDEDLVNGNYYRVNMVFGNAEENYLIEISDERGIECEARLFEECIPTRVRYVGIQRENGSVEQEDDFEIGTEYEIAEYLYNDEYVMDNGKKTNCFFVEPVAFKKKPSAEKKSITQKDAIRAVMRAIEFKDVKNLYQMLDENSVYNSISTGRFIRGRDDIIEYFENIADNMLEKEVFADCYYQEDTDEETEDTFYIEYSYNESDKCKVAINDKYITRITIGNG